MPVILLLILALAGLILQSRGKEVSGLAGDFVSAASGAMLAFYEASSVISGVQPTLTVLVLFVLGIVILFEGVIRADGWGKVLLSSGHRPDPE